MVEISASTLTLGLGELIRCKRKEKQMTLPQLSDLSGTPEATLSRIETGETRSPEFRTILVIASTLDIPIDEITEFYIEAECSSEALFTVLGEALPNSLPVPLIMKIATTFLAFNQRETSEESVERLYNLAIETKEIPQKLALFKVISEFSDDHGIRPTLAKALFQSYLIERDDFTKLSKTYEPGKNIQYHAKFLSVDDQITYYYKLGAHAYHLGKYEDCIELCKEVITLDYSEGTLKAYAVQLTAFSYFFLDRYDLAEKYVNILKHFSSIPSIEEQVSFLTAKLDGKKGDIDLAIIQLENRLDTAPHKVAVMFDLMELYLKQKDVQAIERLLLHEKDFMYSTHPSIVSEYAFYYEKKSEYFLLTNEHNKAFECLLDSIIMFISVDRHHDIDRCIGIILSEAFRGVLHDAKLTQVLSYLTNK
ncbi:helix-turn-helix domain-containing protein [Paenibacillus sp. UMB4589-SE434]|uniref:helix-turn-helix domain-containing protein n=1 Tax=Paenibacillus sp. UMB4589-SE434 TaxID=3046314 RepID=UPI00254E76B0|nr:helix-turn-helix domain-containing protein [Paenibacillus sp. UMB4589-SE434]MDK8182040.1 helix-turn-helix domain-containing protein [Paenibacillus sp. UMB4589-SE434]